MQSHNKDNSQHDSKNYRKILSSKQSLDDKIKSYLDSVFMIKEDQIKNLIGISQEKEIKNLDDIIKIFSSRGNFSFDNSLQILIDSSETKKIQNLDDILQIYIKSKKSYYERIKIGDHDLINDELKILINNSETKKIQNLSQIIENYLNLTHYFTKLPYIIDGIDASNYFFKIDINNTFNILLENSNSRNQEKIQILEAAINLLENNQHKEIIVDVLKSQIKKIPDSIQKCIQNNKIQFYIRSDEQL
jgi:hypothetical protein